MELCHTVASTAKSPGLPCSWGAAAHPTAGRYERLDTFGASMIPTTDPVNPAECTNGTDKGVLEFGLFPKGINIR